MKAAPIGAASSLIRRWVRRGRGRNEGRSDRSGEEHRRRAGERVGDVAAMKAAPIGAARRASDSTWQTTETKPQ